MTLQDHNTNKTINMYSILDGAAKFFINPFFAENDAHATRMFCGSLGDSFPHRADFSLHYLAKFDIETGEVITDSQHCVIQGRSLDVSLDPRIPAPTIYGVGPQETPQQ